MPVPHNALALVASFLGNFPASDEDRVMKFYEDDLESVGDPARELVFDFLAGLGKEPSTNELMSLARDFWRQANVEITDILSFKEDVAIEAEMFSSEDSAVEEAEEAKHDYGHRHREH